MHKNLSALTIGLGLLSTISAHAESIHIRASESERVEATEDGTIKTTTEERTVEQSRETGESMRATVRSVNLEDSAADNGSDVTRYSRTCVNGDCEVTDSNGTKTVRKTEPADNTWWESWHEKILDTLKMDRTAVASAKDSDEPSTAPERMQARLARRVCLWFSNERDVCLNDAAEREGLSMRDKLGSWIDQL